MKILFGEFPANYEKYHFPYQVWLLREDGDDVAEIYGRGFLPFRSIKNLYYLSRSVRVDLAKFELSSENRRILRKTEKFEFELVKLDKLDYTPLVQKTCKNWFNQKLGKGKISAAAIRKIFKAGIFTHVFVWKTGSRRSLSRFNRGSNSNPVVGYAIAFINDDLLHYAHVFYNLEFSKSNLGARMMLEMIIWAKENEKKYIYLGTCYTHSALYKTQYAGVQFFNGFSWSNNIKELKYLIDKESDDYLFQNKEYLNLFQPDEGLKRILKNKGIHLNLFSICLNS